MQWRPRVGTEQHAARDGGQRSIPVKWGGASCPPRVSVSVRHSTMDRPDSQALLGLPKLEHFEDCFVAFIDILGFTQKVRAIRTEQDFAEVATVLHILRK